MMFDARTELQAAPGAARGKSAPGADFEAKKDVALARRNIDADLTHEEAGVKAVERLDTETALDCEAA